MTVEFTELLKKRLLAVGLNDDVEYARVLRDTFREYGIEIPDGVFALRIERRLKGLDKNANT